MTFWNALYINWLFIYHAIPFQLFLVSPPTPTTLCLKIYMSAHQLFMFFLYYTFFSYVKITLPPKNYYHGYIKNCFITKKIECTFNTAIAYVISRTVNFNNILAIQLNQAVIMDME